MCIIVCVALHACCRRCLSISVRQNAADGSQRKETAQADNLMDIGTRSIYTEEHDMFRRTVRKFFQEEVAPNHAELADEYYYYLFQI